MCLCQILAALAGAHDQQTRKNDKNNIGIDADTPAITSSPSAENNKPSSTARTYSEDSSSRSKGGGSLGGSSKTGDEATSGSESKEDKAKKERKAKIRKRAIQIKEDNERRHEAAKAKGNVYEVYDPNDMDEYY